MFWIRGYLELIIGGIVLESREVEEKKADEAMDKKELELKKIHQKIYQNSKKVIQESSL